MSTFVHLHLHSGFSLLDGACDHGTLAKTAAKYKMPAVAVTDHGNLFGAIGFYEATTKYGVKPILGCELYIEKTSRFDRDPASGRPYHLIVLCENERGYKNLVKLVSKGYLEGFYYKPRIDKDLLSQHSEGLIGLSACLNGEVASNVLGGRADQAERAAGEYLDIFGRDRFFLEIHNHGLEKQRKIIPDMLQISARTGIRPVATNDCHYMQQDDCRAHDILLCIQTGKTVNDPNRMKFYTDQFYFKTREEMNRVFGELPFVLDQSVEIAERCCLQLQKVQNPFPEFTVPPGYTIDTYFAKIVHDGFQDRLELLKPLAGRGLLKNPLSAYEARLEEEIRIIQGMKYSGYFLIVWDLIRYARENDIPVGPGRGSAAGSLVSYCMRITDLDPLQYGLLFERFLNPERVTLPDIDIDFCMNRRGKVIEYVTQKYGRDNVSQIITFGTMLARGVIRDAGRGMEMTYAEVDKIAKMVPLELKMTLDKALEENPDLKSLVQNDERVRELVDVAKRLEGLARHASTHAAGVVISPQPLTEVVPIYKTNRDEITTQYDMNALERIGLLKMDFLGLTTLTVLDDSVKLVEQNRGMKIDLGDLPLDDPDTYKPFCRSETTGIFQFESHGMRDILRRYQPSRLEDLTALNALYRPGPIQGGMIDDFIDRKHGRKKVSYDLPVLQEILEETYGVILYQEQVMQIANRLAGFSLGEADILRRAMGKKNRDEMAAQREKFLTGCAAHKVPPKKAERIFDLMAEFAGYGFNKSHSCAYALLAYQTAWLKTHYPVEFMAALLTSETGNTDKVVKYIHEARVIGIQVLPPAVHESALYFTPVGEAIRFGLAAIKNVGENPVRGILEARQKLGSFRSIFELCDSVDPRLLNRRVLESLVKAGALDSLGARRSQLYQVIDRAMERGQKLQRDSASTQHGLFLAGASSQEFSVPELPDAEEWPEYELLANEFATLGFYISGHPLDKYSARLKELKAVELSAMEGRRNGEEVAIGALVSSLRPMRSRKGDRWAILNLQDMTGQLEALVFPEAFARLETLLKSAVPLLLRGRVSVEDAGTRVAIQEAQPLDGIAGAPDATARMRVRIDLSPMDEFTLDQIKTVLAGSPGPCPIAFDIFDPDGSMATLASNQRVRIDDRLVNRLQEMPGVGPVEVVR